MAESLTMSADEPLGGPVGHTGDIDLQNDRAPQISPGPDSGGGAVGLSCLDIGRLDERYTGGGQHRSGRPLPCFGFGGERRGHVLLERPAR